MSTENNISFFKKHKFFLKLFGIPSICWVLLELWTMDVPNDDGTYTTWAEFFQETFVVIAVWFIISLIIVLIVNEVKKSKPKTKIIKEIQYIQKPDDKIVINNSDADNLKQQEIKNEKTKKKNGKYLYACESIINADEYKKAVKYFPQLYWSYVLYGTIINIVATAIFVIIFQNLVWPLIFFILFELYVMILYRIRLNHMAEKSFNSMKKKKMIDSNIHTEFYENYFIRQGENTTYRLNYEDINSCIENDTNFYLQNKNINRIIIIQKNSCSLELINFIRSKYKNLEDYTGNKKRKELNQCFFPLIMTIITFIIGWWLFYMTKGDSFGMRLGLGFFAFLPTIVFFIILVVSYFKCRTKASKDIILGLCSILTFLLLSYYICCIFIGAFAEAEHPITDIHSYKEKVNGSRLLKVFPKEIPDDVKNIKFKYSPGVLQAGTDISLYYVDKNMTLEMFDKFYKNKAIWIGHIDDYNNRPDKQSSPGIKSGLLLNDAATYENANDYVIYLIESYCDNSGYCNHASFLFAAFNEKTNEVIYASEEW